jgi:hypothetical protein
MQITEKRFPQIELFPAEMSGLKRIKNEIVLQQSSFSLMSVGRLVGTYNENSKWMQQVSLRTKVQPFIGNFFAWIDSTRSKTHLFY